jgi:hypothetical protein
MMTNKGKGKAMSYKSAQRAKGMNQHEPRRGVKIAYQRREARIYRIRLGVFLDFFLFCANQG